MKLILPISLLCLNTTLSALEPKEIFLIVNKDVPASEDIAKHYCKQRQVPTSNILSFSLPKKEDISRHDYNTRLLAPLRNALKEKKANVKCLLTIYGVPLRVGNQLPTKEERAKLDQLAGVRKKLRAERSLHRVEVTRLQKLIKIESTEKLKADLTEAKAKLTAASNKLRPIETQWKRYSHSESRASVDSELSLLWRDGYTLDRWQTNEFYWRNQGRVKTGKEPMVMVARLDGSSPKLVKRLIDDALATEKKGLQGKVYVDARGIKHRKGASPYGYSGYDESLRAMAKLLKEKKHTVILDNKNSLFKPQSCADCALYCGWYSHAKFIDCCQFARGAVAYHIASSEAVSLRRPGARYWCKNLLEKGAAVTLGPVAEPYTVGFPKPDEFFKLLTEGKHTLVECYWKSQLLTSWMMVLVGDPLYRPFPRK